ncbi:UvrD-helicase domain-containing protein [Mesobacillus jeotgali]|uniref:AAA family ATPase n=1 Tax=Mesobacillus jeotgali TaxID=129985 RepID=A0ABY9VLL4_9BACI|nr:UvrD-helicase domain-containing protein [Mesobacillus jeotgali]WNF24844.1 AAA family ATPase [Mesobacillus jeotgali]
MKKDIIHEEQNTLDKTVIKIDGIIKSLGDELKNNTTNDVLLERTNRRFINDYLDARKNPYFGRIDTYEDGKRETYYIGYTSVAKDKNQDIIYSWKSSVGDLFAQFHGGEGNIVIDRGPNEKYDFNVLLKRSLLIEKLRVKKYSDTVSEQARKELGTEVDNVLFDDFLMDILDGRNNETQLKDIVMTIQKEQNEIIRLPIDNSIIVQGVAGSGKSSIALTRISYLLTRYKEKLTPADIGILAPNEMFISYIQSVMPTLEIENIPQFTFKTLSKTVLKNLDVDNFNDPINSLSGLVNGDSTVATNYKTSIEFKEKIDFYLEEFKNQFVHNIKEFRYFDTITNTDIILSRDQILNRYEDLSYLSLVKRNQEILKYVEKWVDSLLISKQEELKKEFESVINTIFNGIPKTASLRKQTYESIEKVYSYRQKVLRDELNQRWRDYKSNWENFELFTLYQRILILEDLYHGKVTTVTAFKKHLEYDDLTPLMYLEILLNGVSKQYQHLVVDESQDLSPFQIHVLKLLSKSMTLLGDVTQNIYLEKGINDWTKLIEKVFLNDKVRLIEINTSYRSTNPIMEGANFIAANAQINAPKIVPIGRKGDRISIEKIYDPLRLLDHIIETIKSLQKKGFKKIAVVHKDLKRSVSLHERLVKQFSSIQLVTNSIQTVNKDVIIIPSFLTKGLEFDAVIIPNASKRNYDENELDAKLLFVSMTRAQHYVKLFYHQELTTLLNGIEIPKVEREEEDYSFL